ncbi:unnamed protein product [Ranitomeya imitator]|uniref:G-protein coupled receptors family 3 profile domain-containing protein n=1 Tax=Ranitomeya imitator TaxID=111125 RepID=A0ABN9MMA8_9NEOB|nr:unnamed protein product [Ranitomeya imitator]
MILQGKPTCCYDCVPCPRGEVNNHTDMSSCWKCPDDQWPNGKKNECIKKKIIYLSYEDFLGTALACSAIVLSLASLFILAIFIHYQNSLVIKATNRNLSFLLLLSLTFTFCSCLVFVGHPGHITCLLRQTVFGMSFTVSVSSLLAKTILVVMAFRAIKPVLFRLLCLFLIYRFISVFLIAKTTTWNNVNGLSKLSNLEA